MRPVSRASIRGLFHYGWAAAVVAALLLHLIWPVDPDYPIWAASLLAYPVGAALILANRPGNRVGLMLGAVGAAAAVIFVGSWAATVWGDRPWTLYLEALLSPAVPVMFWGVLGLLYVFPTGHIPFRWARWLFYAFTGLIASAGAASLLIPGPMLLSGRDNPLAGPGWTGEFFDASVVVMLPMALVGVATAFARWRGASGVEQQQMRWFLAGTIALVGLVVVIGFVPELPDPYEMMLAPVVIGGFWALPVAIVMAILRYRLYDIDRIISRTVAYSLVLALLAGIYLMAVLAMQILLPVTSNVAVAGSTLLVAAMFSPVLRRVRWAVDRRFNRTRFDAERELEGLAHRLRDATDPLVISRELLATIGRTLQPGSVGLWTRRPPSHVPEAAYGSEI